MTNDVKKKYEKPFIIPVDLEAEEVLGVGCKSNAGGAPADPASCTGTPCAGDGS